jgi:hypothetical protein
VGGWFWPELQAPPCGRAANHPLLLLTPKKTPPQKGKALWGL